MTLHRPRRHAPARRRAAATCSCTSRSRRPTRLDAEQEELLRKLAALRGEDGPDVGTVTGQQHGFFSRLRDAFNER